MHVSFWPKEGAQVEQIPSLEVYRNTSLEPLMIALLVDAPAGASQPHVAEFPGLPELQSGEKQFVNASADFPLASYEISVGLERLSQVWSSSNASNRVLEASCGSTLHTPRAQSGPSTFDKHTSIKIANNSIVLQALPLFPLYVAG